jgi:hypothetical protein
MFGMPGTSMLAGKQGRVSKTPPEGKGKQSEEPAQKRQYKGRDCNDAQIEPEDY